MSPIPTKLTIAPRGYSWHGQKLQKDFDGLPCRPACPPPARQRPSDCLAAPAEAGQGVGTPTLEQFQRWLETQAHEAYHAAPSHAADQRIASCRLATLLLMEFQA